MKRLSNKENEIPDDFLDFARAQIRELNMDISDLVLNRADRIGRKFNSEAYLSYQSVIICFMTFRLVECKEKIK